MNCTRLALLAITTFTCTFIFAQADFIEHGSRNADVLDRFEIKLRTDETLNYSTVKPYDRRIMTGRLEYIDSMSKAGRLSLSRVEKYNLDVVLKDNFDWRSNRGDTSLRFANLFKQTHFTTPFYFGVKRGDFSIYSTLLYNFQVGKDNNVHNTLYNNSRELFYMRGTLAKGLGFYSYVTDNQQRNPLYVQQFTNKYLAVPGLGYFKNKPNNVYDLYDVKGGIMFKATKGIDVQFAFDKVFIGNGYRSLILSDFSNSYLFLKINTRFWKFNYYNLFAQMVDRGGILTDTLYPRKYMAFHCLDFAVTKWLNIGLFEHIMFSRQNGFDGNYLNPVILYASMGHQLGSPDKTTVGFNIKANAFKNTQLYGQLIVNEFVLDEVLHYSRGWWANKQAFQLGFKKIDVLGIKDLDIQGELNVIRPFVYTHDNRLSNFTHYNQPLAHPLGANLKEVIGIVKYQPIPRLSLKGKLIYYEQGIDSGNSNYGSNIFKNYNDRYDALGNKIDYGYKTTGGVLAKCLLAQFSASFELLPNLFLDADYLYRSYKTAITTAFNSTVYNVGFRFNIKKREYDF